MGKQINGYSVVAEDDIWETIDEDQSFNEFIGKCVSHFVHFVIPRRDQSNEIEQDYPIPENIEIVSSSLVSLRRTLDNQIVVSFSHW